MSTSIVQNRWDNAGFSLAKKSRQCLGERANYISNTMPPKESGNSTCFHETSALVTVAQSVRQGKGGRTQSHPQITQITPIKNQSVSNEVSIRRLACLWPTDNRT